MDKKNALNSFIDDFEFNYKQTNLKGTFLNKDNT